MDVKLASYERVDKPVEINFLRFKKMVKNREQNIFYLDKSNSKETIEAIRDSFEKLDYMVYVNKIEYGPNEEEYIYEIHIV